MAMYPMAPPVRRAAESENQVETGKQKAQILPMGIPMRAAKAASAPEKAMPAPEKAMPAPEKAISGPTKQAASAAIHTQQNTEKHLLPPETQKTSTPPDGRAAEPRTTETPAAHSGLKSTERLFIEKTLIQMYPRLQHHDLFPWKLLNGPLIPDFLIPNTPAHLRRILVIGCGDGLFANILSLLFPEIEIVGIDTDATQITRAKATIGYRQNLKFICGNPVTMRDIPCDRIIYNHCLTRGENIMAYRKLLMKTLGWLVNEGDFIVRESAPALILRPDIIKELWPILREQQCIEGVYRKLIAGVGYPNPALFSYGHLPHVPSELFYHSPKTMKLTAMVAKPVHSATGEWQDVGDQSTDSVVGFLFANQLSDFTREFV